MPSPKQRRNRITSTGGVDPLEWQFFNDQPRGADSLAAFFLDHDRDVRDRGSRTAQLWHVVEADVLRGWVKRHPGTRPSCWWAFSSPEPARATVRGHGVANLARGLTVEHGRPQHWHTRSDDLCIESEAAFLKRHALLAPGELARIRPEAFEPDPCPLPEPYTFSYDDSDDDVDLDGGSGPVDGDHDVDGDGDDADHDVGGDVDSAPEG